MKQTAIGRRIHGRRAVAKGEGTGQIGGRCPHAARCFVHLPARTRRQPCDAPRVERAGRSWRGENDAARLSCCHTEHGAPADRIGAARRGRPPGRRCTREGSARSAGEVPGRAVARGCRQGLSGRTRSRIRLTAAGTPRGKLRQGTRVRWGGGGLRARDWASRNVASNRTTRRSYAGPPGALIEEGHEVGSRARFGGAVGTPVA